MRRSAWLTAVVAGIGLLAACAPSPATGSAPAEPGFPVTISHAKGSATVGHRPRRVVVLGSADAQIASALDLPVVAAVRSPSSADGNWPGLAKPLPAAVLTLDALNPRLEAVAAAAPDLILATSAQPAYGAVYDKLAAMAPVITYRHGLLQDDGDELVTMIGQAAGEEARARELVASSHAAIEAVKRELPGLAGRKVAFGQYTGGKTYLAASDHALSVRLLGQLGLRVPEQLSALAGQAEGYAASLGMVTPSAENLGVLDSADLALISTYGSGAREEFTRIPLVAKSSLAARGRLNLINQDLATTLLTPTPATTGYLLEQLKPLLAKAVS
ncbi:iron-siderophore ABC transporter substrate-binding protein [Kutzneria viridogrisea]|uniref:Fe/B12 periplasmic-binding domain-containing protein n=2 Tax=Kutzneria TaxID=43356 RepID=W5W833_9PSEU|nr:ABC transporter substrate-binding protein [Kutzneria albida]AHH97092.1 hypothetical protein KALB_3728 [Kutzneria albida DSM 43870]MBA8931937.1 iron complex transport system substrate-binding protein [Kutzneria viridogrisea]